MIFDWTVTLGNLLTLVGMLGGGLYAITAIKSDMALISQRVGRAETDLRTIADKMDQLSQVLIQIAHQEEKLNQLDERLSALRSAFDLSRIK